MPPIARKVCAQIIVERRPTAVAIAMRLIELRANGRVKNAHKKSARRLEICVQTLYLILVHVTILHAFHFTLLVARTTIGGHSEYKREATAQPVSSLNARLYPAPLRGSAI